jgi:hypothetical protein
MAKKRAKIPDEILEKVLLDSRRRCCICFEGGETEVREGVVAHIVPADTKPTDTDNLVFLCLKHHALLDAGKISADRLRKAKKALSEDLEESTSGGEVSAGSSAYEQHVCRLFAHELRKHFKNCVKVHEDGDYPGKVGTGRDVACSAELNVAGVPVLLILEAKYSPRQVGVTDLEYFASLLKEIKADKGVFVTNTGFSPSAIQFADHHSISLVVLSVDEKTWNAGIR